MGQSASTQRESEAFAHRDSRRFSELRHMRDSSSATRDRRPDRDMEESPINETSAPTTPRPRSRQPFATFRREVSSQSISATRDTLGTDGDATTHDEVLYEQEERPLMNMEDLRMRDAPITNITASPLPRRPSVLSRLGSRLLPRYTTTGSSAADRGENGERRTLRRRLSDTPPVRPTVTPDTHHQQRFSVFGNLSPTSTSSSRSSPRRHLAPISRPIPLMADASVPPSGLPATSLNTTTTDTPAAPTARPLASNSIRNSRMSRIRRSISSLDSLFTGNHDHSSNERQGQTPPRRPLRTVTADETDYLLPPLNVTDTSLDLDENTIGGNDGPEQRQPESSSVAESAERRPGWHHRWADRESTGSRGPRRMPNLLRGRSSRIIRRDDEAPLSRILQIAAAAIAAQLSGAPSGITDLEPMADDTLDGSLNAFMESLNNPAATGTSNNDSPQPFTNLPPLNFLRVFRFVNSNSDSPQGLSRVSSQSSGRSNRANQGSAVDDTTTDGRTVTLVVVGVRSVPSSSITREEGNGDLDAILNLPLVPSPLRTASNGGGLLRHANGRSRLTTRRRASVGGVNPFPANYDSQRHQRGTQGTSRPVSGDTTPVTAATIPVILSESPPGPHPPPSTPAEPGLSAQPSGTTTPNRRPSSAGTTQHTPGAYHDNILERLNETHDMQNSSNDPYNAVRQRRRSDSEFARHRDLGAGAARRNGVVEPDEAIPQARSWLIYVVGTNLSEDHPAFATPSLFTDVCTPASFRLSLLMHLIESYLRGHAYAFFPLGPCQATSRKSRRRFLCCWRI
jgi:hypothetical protein